MSFILIDMSTENFEFRASVWNWRTVLGIIKSFDVVDARALRQMANNASGTAVSKEEANTIGMKIREQVLPKLVPNKRIFANLTITDKPEDGTIYKDEDEKWKNYSATHDWLEDFAEFCIKSKGFRVY